MPQVDVFCPIFALHVNFVSSDSKGGTRPCGTAWQHVDAFKQGSGVVVCRIHIVVDLARSSK